MMMWAKRKNIKFRVTLKFKAVHSFLLYNTMHLQTFRAERSIIHEPRRKKTCLRWFANKGADQPAHLRSLISAYVIGLLECIIYELATSEILIH